MERPIVNALRSPAVFPARAAAAARARDYTVAVALATPPAQALERAMGRFGYIEPP